MATGYLEHTLAAAGTNGNKKATFSAWLKRAKTGVEHVFYTVRQDSNNFFRFRFNDDDTLNVTSNTSGTNYYATADGKYRDTNAWYHVVIAYDTTQATEANRIRIYVNGVEKGKSASNYPSQDATLFMIASGQPQRVGQESGGGYYDGLMAHVHYTEGYAYAATDFGETDSTSGIWVPKTSPSVTYGTNGFFLKFENSGAMGTDSSGGSNTFTVSNSVTQNIDSPTNNFATLSRLYYTTESGTLDFGNRNFTKSSSVNRSCFSTLAPSAGKWYCEVKVANDTDCKLGIVNLSYEYNLNGQTVDFAASGGAYSYNENGQKQEAGASAASYGTGYNAADIIGIAMDLDNSKLYFSLNGTFQNSGVPTSGSTGTGAISITAGGDYAFAGKVNGGCDLGFNFGSGDYSTSSSVASSNADDNGIGSFEYDVPAGYYALCTKNIKEFG